MSINLDFSGHNTLYATHGLHSYAAKCPPQLVKFALEKFTVAGDLVLDPMVGSGTTLVEAKIHNRNSLGFDIDPLACLIAKVKSNFIKDHTIEEASNYVISQVRHDLDSLEHKKRNNSVLKRVVSPEFLNRDYWFTESVQKELSLLSFHISSVSSKQVREFLWVAYSGIILSKVSVANARDIIHSRHHYLKHQDEPNVLHRFEKRVQKTRKQMQEFGRLCIDSDAKVKVKAGDARSLPLESNSIDLVFTSPPYATALDYPRAHFLAVNWMQSALGVDYDQYKQRGETYIGSERGKLKDSYSGTGLGNQAQDIVSKLSIIDYRKSRLIERYFHDMSRAIEEMERVLKPGKHAVMVVCPSHIRKIEIQTHKVFNEIALSLDMKIVAEYTRRIDSSKRVLPYVRGGFGNRMSTEYVLVYKKGGARCPMTT